MLFVQKIESINQLKRYILESFNMVVGFSIPLLIFFWRVQKASGNTLSFWADLKLSK